MTLHTRIPIDVDTSEDKAPSDECGGGTRYEVL